MHERIFERLEDAAVGVHAGAGGTEFDLFGFVARQIPHHLAVAFEQTLGRHHARLPNIPLELLAELAHRPGTALL